MANEIKEKLAPLNSDFPIELCRNKPDTCLLRKRGLVEVINEDLGE